MDQIGIGKNVIIKRTDGKFFFALLPFKYTNLRVLYSNVSFSMNFTINGMLLLSETIK